jgi:hypothetical protein
MDICPGGEFGREREREGYSTDRDLWIAPPLSPSSVEGAGLKICTPYQPDVSRASVGNPARTRRQTVILARVSPDQTAGINIDNPERKALRGPQHAMPISSRQFSERGVIIADERHHEGWAGLGWVADG